MGRFLGASRWLRSPRLGVVLGVLAPIGMLALSAAMLFELRRDAWDEAARTSRNLLQVIEQDIERNIEVIDLSLRGAAENLNAPGVAEADPALRQLMLFDRATTAQDIGVMLVLDETGEAVFDAASYPPRKINNADRDYFKAHQAERGLGLLISRPLVSRLTGAPIVVLSRRIDKPDGSFGGVALVSLKLSYFDRLFARVGLGKQGAVNLYLDDGTRLMRHPYVAADIGANIAGAPTFERFKSERQGSFVATSVRDGVERRYEFTRVGELPLILNVALSSAEIEGEWRVRALVIGVVLAALCGLTIALSLLFGRELRRRSEIEVELARLSRTDPLTGLANRRRYEELLASGFEEARRTAGSLALLIVDADHFKRHNDRYGHAAGDELLKRLARRLEDGARRAGDTAARIGGEEFAVLLPGADIARAAEVADDIHAAVARLSVEGGVTVSIGLAVAGPGGAAATPEELYRLADAALYEAKDGGRNRTCRAAARGTAAFGGLRVVGVV
ncbi:GGDEF domain-containing protein [Chenggangzhangella methanolivorans]|uniref:diguanylate cyclase n=1 Tax=Chenggangzhangella methanolivorans TaxID=1437009 RepID=A0A9E6RB89_9HYPH|nr:sensor domain-containing diguanylate cyclase [Chenggangzhangella methanolivorans]QZO01180.1 sensor domain-containing diguanylate cyclase [Chenggangzhangella methanolivorans]